MLNECLLLCAVLQSTIAWCGSRSAAQVSHRAATAIPHKREREEDAATSTVSKGETETFTLGEDKDMQDACLMLTDFIQKFGAAWVKKMRASVGAAGVAGPGVHDHMEWITPQFLAEAVHTRMPCRMVVDLHMWLMKMLVDMEEQSQAPLLTEVTWCEVLRELMLKRLQQKARRMLSEEQDLSEQEVDNTLITLRMCALAAADEEGAVETEVDIIDVNWVADSADALESGGFVKPKGWRGGGAGGKPDRYRGVGRLSDGAYMAKLSFKNGSEKILGTNFSTSAEAARSWDHAVIRQYGGNVTGDCLNFDDSFDDVLLILSQGQADLIGTAREPLSELATVRQGDCGADVGVRGALAILHKYFADELIVIRALVRVLSCSASANVRVRRQLASLVLGGQDGQPAR